MELPALTCNVRFPHCFFLTLSTHYQSNYHCTVTYKSMFIQKRHVTKSHTKQNNTSPKHIHPVQISSEEET